MQGLMMDQPLSISSLLVHADRYHGDTEIVSRRVEGDIHRYTYHDAHQRSRRAANMLERLGVAVGERAATLAWNGYRHFELYYAISGSGRVMHTINPRLHPEQVAWIANDAQDQVLFFDLTFAPLVDAVAPHCPNIKHWVALCAEADLPALKNIKPLAYETLLEQADSAYDWPLLDEQSAACLCYTSGTTGNPKGVLYSHRSTVLHAMGSCMPDVMNLSACDVVLPVVPMFHVNAWGTPYSCPIVGAKLVFPGPALDGASLTELFEQEKVTFTAGVPTVWLGLLQHLQKSGQKLTTVNRMVVGGSACPPALMKAFKDEFGIHIHHAWGMTEMSPLGTFNQLKNKHLPLSAEEQFKVHVRAGRPVFGVDIKIVDDAGKDLPWDGVAFGDLLVKGYWVVGQYYGLDKSPLVDGWFPTGDVATIDPDGFIQITDRSKDVIKSGGEWISSIDLENIAVSHPAVAEAGVIGVYHPKWDERPLLVVVLKDGQDVDRDALLAHFDGKIAKWMLPDDVQFVTELPHTATGKISKLKLREQFKDYRLPTV
ncbi:fatty-acid--CoA ligase [Flagellatimonas centrodinii]|uniref:3-(methylthio)propionyl-CoA ligase n=1 Tax=Flagellatimonas centrodinii TaxID=2806210 RepID=UPI001EFB9940|nr:3-(methylthio)propionyl-CoA ligase [Flagellatimonas centrodinii]ULQ46132.1 fatty-acid--CoA ligase [Flagellatimonas centrodinii]